MDFCCGLKDTSSTLWLVGALGNSNNHFNFRIGSAGAFEAYQYEFSAQYGTFNLNTAKTSAMDGNWHHIILIMTALNQRIVTEFVSF